MRVQTPDRADERPARLPEHFFARVTPTIVVAPRLIRLNKPLALNLRIDPDWLASNEGVEILAGKRVPIRSCPLGPFYGPKSSHYRLETASQPGARNGCCSATSAEKPRAQDRALIDEQGTGFRSRTAPLFLRAASCHKMFDSKNLPDVVSKNLSQNYPFSCSPTATKLIPFVPA